VVNNFTRFIPFWLRFIVSEADITATLLRLDQYALDNNLVPYSQSKKQYSFHSWGTAKGNGVLPKLACNVTYFGLNTLDLGRWEIKQ
jgi:hypothetical protein